MAEYPDVDGERRFDPGALTASAVAIFEACGMSAEDAHIVSDSLVAADKRGIHSHGLLRIEDYVKKLLDDGVDPKGRPSIVSRKAGAIRVDGANALGQIPGVSAMRAAIEAARETGIAFAAVGQSNHCGALDYYTLMAAEAGMVGIAGTNALPTMAPWGGRDKIVGLNPISIAMPTEGRRPFVLDTALGATAHGKIRVYAQKGAPIPEGWAFDAEGAPTTDATAALEGLIQPIGAFKGIGLAMAVGLLSTLLSDAGYGTESGNMVDGAYAGKDGQFYMAIDVASFVDPAVFQSRLKEIIAAFEASARISPDASIHAPGSLEANIAERYAREGVPLNEECLATIRRSAARANAPEGVFAERTVS